MRDAPGRKSIVWITGGFPQIHAYEGAIQRALAKINDMNVAIYPIDARGLTFATAIRNIRMMEQFAESTGGVAYYNGNDISAAIEEAVKDSRVTYAIGFYLSDKERDRRFHELKVTVKRPGAIVRCRRGYTPASTSLDSR
jgi:VWFA-related protein